MPLTQTQTRTLAERALRLERLYAHSPAAWLEDQAMTLDEASGQARPWPREPVIRELVEHLHRERLVVIPKSRRRFVTWAVSGFLWWSARFEPHKFCVVQSLTEEKASFIVDRRIEWMEQHIREPLFRRTYKKWKGGSGYTKRIRYDHTDSTILGVIEGGEAVRTYTISRMVIDECEFQPHFHEALVAAKPLLEPDKNVQLILVSTPNGPSQPLASICREVGFTRWG